MESYLRPVSICGALVAGRRESGQEAEALRFGICTTLVPREIHLILFSVYISSNVEKLHNIKLHFNSFFFFLTLLN